MNISEYVNLLSHAYISDTSKFTSVSLERPRTKGQPVNHYHLLLQKEKHLESVVRKILPKKTADCVCQAGSRLAHLYRFPKTHKEKLSMRTILSATGTYNYALAKWLDESLGEHEKLKPLSFNRYTVSFAEEIQNLVIDENDILVSFDVTSLFTNVPLQETIKTIAKKAFVDNWFNVTHNLNITKPDLVQLLEVATMNQLFQFDGKLYEQIDGVAMGSPLGPLMANAFLCSIEEKLDQDSELPEFYTRYVDDTFAIAVFHTVRAWV